MHNASVMNAIGICGLQLYRYGETVSIPFFTETWRPDSFYEKIQRNRNLGLHTLCLLGGCFVHKLAFKVLNFNFSFSVSMFYLNMYLLLAEEKHELVMGAEGASV